EPARGNLLFRQLNGAEVPFAVRSEATIHQQPGAAILEVVSLLFQSSYTFIGRTDAIYLIADVLGVFPGEGGSGPNWIQLLRHHDRDLPFISGFGNIRPARNLRTKDDAPFRAGFRSAAA